MAAAQNKYSEFLLSYQPGRITDLPVVSPCARKLIAANGDRPLALGELAEAFSTDIFLAAKLFSVSNSIFYNLGHQDCFDAKRALTRVGADYATRLLRRSKVFDQRDSESASVLWLHSLTVAHTAQALCRRMKSCAVGEDLSFFVAIIHDIGYLIEADYDPGRLREIAGRLRRNEKTADTHTLLGESLTAYWSLPPHVREAVRWHHEPFHAGTPAGRLLAALVFAAEAAACAHHGRGAGTKHGKVLALLGLRDGDFAHAVAVARATEERLSAAVLLHA